MVELQGIPLEKHLESIIKEFTIYGSIYGYPKQGFYKNQYPVDTQIRDKNIITPIGIAAGPHSQLAHNIVLSFLHGARTFELKLAQRPDDLEVLKYGRFKGNGTSGNGWNQTVDLGILKKEFINAYLLLKALESEEILGIEKGHTFYRTLFDLSVGVDLRGITSARMKNWMNRLVNGSECIGEALDQLPERFSFLKGRSISPFVANSVTLSVFHGCSVEEVESIACYLMEEFNLHLNVKMCPTLLPLPEVERFVYEEMGGGGWELDPTLFETESTFGAYVSLLRRLRKIANEKGLQFGVKISNAIVLKRPIDREREQPIIPQPITFILSMFLLKHLRDHLGLNFPLSFSGGINQYNIAQIVSCGVFPTTVSTDLFRVGGYKRLAQQMKCLADSMVDVGARDIDSFIRARAQNFRLSVPQASAFNVDRVMAKILKTGKVGHAFSDATALPSDRKHVALTCEGCEFCLTVCPNNALFSFPLQNCEVNIVNYQVDQGVFIPVHEKILPRQRRQVGVIDELCQAGGNCATYCHDNIRPSAVKPRFFVNKKRFYKHPDQEQDGYYFASFNALGGRIAGKEYLLSELPGETFAFKSKDVQMTFDKSFRLLSAKLFSSRKDKVFIAMHPFYQLFSYLKGMDNSRNGFHSIFLRGAEQIERKDRSLKVGAADGPLKTLAKTGQLIDK